MTFDQDELRLVALSGELMLKMNRDKERKLLDKLYGQFRNGDDEKVCMRTVAEFCVVRDQFTEINSALRQAHEPEKKER